MVTRRPQPRGRARRQVKKPVVVPDPVPCRVCGTPIDMTPRTKFSPQLTVWQRGQLCSRECMNENSRRNRERLAALPPCDICGNPIVRELKGRPLCGGTGICTVERARRWRDAVHEGKTPPPSAQRDASPCAVCGAPRGENGAMQCSGDSICRRMERARALRVETKESARGHR